MIIDTIRFERLAKEKRDIEEAFRKLQVESANEVKHVKKQYDEIARELHSQTTEIERLKKQLTAQSHDRNHGSELEEKVVGLKRELKTAKMEIEHLRAENSRYYQSKQVNSDSRHSMTNTNNRARSPSPRISSSPRLSRSPSPARKQLTSSVEKRGSTSRHSSVEKKSMERKKGYESPTVKPPTRTSTNSRSNSRSNSRANSPSLRSKTPTKEERKVPSLSKKPPIAAPSSSRNRIVESPRKQRPPVGNKRSAHKKAYYDTSEDESDLMISTDQYTSHIESSNYNTDEDDFSYSSVEERRSTSRSSSRGKQVASTKRRSTSKR